MVDTIRMSAASKRKHLLLLAVLVLAQLGLPLFVYLSITTRVLSDAALLAIIFYVCFIVFAAGWQRLVAFGLFALTATGTIAVNVLPSQHQKALAVVLHSFIIVFLSFAVTIILRDLFGKSVIEGDDILGAVCGYILGAMVWGNLYGLSYVFAPGAFSVNPAIATQLDDWQRKRSLFDYLSFTTLTSLGYGDITPVGQPAYSLTWLEVLFGQFYMAVVVAQIVGLKLAQAIRERRTDSR